MDWKPWAWELSDFPGHRQSEMGARMHSELPFPKPPARFPRAAARYDAKGYHHLQPGCWKCG